MFCDCFEGFEGRILAFYKVKNIGIKKKNFGDMHIERIMELDETATVGIRENLNKKKQTNTLFTKFTQI